jgi:hypothetical protein
MLQGLHILLVSFSVLAASPDYYTVREDTTARSKAVASLDPFEVFSEAAVQTAAQVLDLLTWQHHQQTLKDPATPYNRLQQYGTWVVDHSTGTCYNTRARVLIRQSEIPVRFKGSGGCVVDSGKWLDPYTDSYFTNANDLDIDHVVPLKNSYDSGAWQWDQKKRCTYANFMANDYHLLAVRKEDNRMKGDGGPDKFMPANSAYACDYLSHWLKIKLIWNLAMVPGEAEGIERLAQQNHCDAKVLSITMQELRGQRQSILAIANICQ